MTPAETTTYRCRVRELNWQDRRHRYRVVTWCRERFGPETQVTWWLMIDDQGHMVIHTCDPLHHRLATLVWG